MATTKFSKKSEVTLKRKAAPVVPEVEVKGTFNKITFSLTKTQVTDKVHNALTAGNTPPDANAKNLLHRVSLPGLEYPTSLGWALKVLIGAEPVGVSAKSMMPRGMYTPAQAMACLDKLTPCGVTLASLSPNVQYQKWSEAARSVINAQKAAEEAAQLEAEKAARRAARKNGKKARK